MIEVDCHILIKKDGILFLNEMKISLLYEIIKCGSLSGAAKELRISYQHAWTMIDEINHTAPRPLVIKQRGGADGGGARISDYGRKILDDYEQIKKHVMKTIRQINTEINF